MEGNDVMNRESLFGLAAEFNGHEQLLRAAERAYQQGFRKMDAYAPFPVEGLAEALGKKNRLPLHVLCGGIVGGVGAYYMQWYANVVSYPLNVGGRPLHSWPAFVPITFELTVLSAALTAFFLSLALSGLPKPYHPMFNLPEFERASQDRFFLCIEADDPRFDRARTLQFLEQLAPVRIAEVAK
jgi:Protein of unknown function (DUF3341)